MENITDIKDYEEENLKEIVPPDTELKNLLVQYVGEHNDLPDGSEVTVEAIVDTVAEQFPEFLLAVAEENWVRGYQQALHDIEYGESSQVDSVGT